MQAPLARDLWCYHVQFLSLHTRDFFTFRGMEMFPYPAGSAWPYALFHNVLPQFHSIPFIGLTFLAVAGLGASFVKALTRLGVGTLKAILIAVAGFLLMYPFLFVWTTGNIEIVLFLVLGCGTLAFVNEKYWLAAILIGFGASMKLYPFVLLGLFLPVRRYKEMLAAIVTFAVSFVSGLWLMCPDIGFSWKMNQFDVKVIRIDYMQTFLLPQSEADHSI